MAGEMREEEVKDLLQSNLAEIEKVLNTKTVVGEPTTIGDTTLIPLISVGFFAGAGGGAASDPKKRGGTGIGTGGGAGVRPVGVVVMDKNGIRIEPIKGGFAVAMEKFTDRLPEIVKAWTERKKAE